MNKKVLVLYLFTRIDSFKGLMSFMTMMGIILLIPYLCQIPRDYVHSVCLISVLLIMTVINVATPSTKDLFFILGLSEVLNNDEAKKLPNNLLKLVNEYVESKLNNKKEE